MATNATSGEAQPTDQNVTAARNSGLSAWGTFFAGLAALMTFFTAVATSYVAVATYNDQKEEDAKKEEAAASDFAQKVELVPSVDGVLTLDNPNTFPLSDVLVFSFWRTRKPDVSVVMWSEKFLLPACSRVTFASAKDWEGLDQRYVYTLPKDAQPNGQGAYFKDRGNRPWLSRGVNAFHRAEELGGNFWDWAGRNGMPMSWYTPDSEDGYLYELDAAGAKFSRSPRCK
ncbi:hypothetical protein [Streptomyces umbrinus]|uniref:hypothetical protein n=1 Tax=Streptomyces umbrinus TaxID=67370 RepID=UPI0033DB6027